MSTEAQEFNLMITSLDNKFFGTDVISTELVSPQYITHNKYRYEVTYKARSKEVFYFNNINEVI